MSPWPGQLSSALLSVTFRWPCVEHWVNWFKEKNEFFSWMPLNFPSVVDSVYRHIFWSSPKYVFPFSVWNWEWQNTPRKDVLIAFPAGTRRKGCQKPREKVYYQEISDPILQSAAQCYNIPRTDSTLCCSWKLPITPRCDLSFFFPPPSHTLFHIPEQSHSTQTRSFQWNELKSGAWDTPHMFKHQ